MLFLLGTQLFSLRLGAQSLPCAAPPPGMVAWWRAEGDANDAVNGNSGTLLNGATFAPGEVGQAFAFNGTNSYIEVPDSPVLRLTNELTIEFWVKRLQVDPPSFPAADYVVEKGGDWTGGVQNYAVALHNPQFNYCLHFVFAGGWRGGGSVADTNWHHCAVVARNGDADPTLYIDGVPQPITYREGASTINLYNSTRPLHIGALLDPATGWFYYSKTLVDELAFYNRALGSNEIQAIFNAGSAGKCGWISAPYMLAPVVIPGGFRVSFAGSPGRAYTLLRAESPSGPWTTLSSIRVGPDGIGGFDDTNAPATRAYYRTAYP